MSGRRLRQRSGTRSRPRIHHCGRIGGRGTSSKSYFFYPTRPAAALQIFAVGSRQSSPKLDSNRKDTENKVNVSDSISWAKSPTPDERICVLVSQGQTVLRTAWTRGLGAAVEGQFSRSEPTSVSATPCMTWRQPGRRRSPTGRLLLAGHHTPNTMQ